MANTPQHVERGGEARPDTPDKWSDRDTARQEQGLPEKPADRGEGKVSPRTPGKAEGDRGAP
jgi:hypothetical protein